MMYSDALIKIRKLEEELAILREFYAAPTNSMREANALTAAEAYYNREDTPNEPV